MAWVMEDYLVFVGCKRANNLVLVEHIATKKPKFAKIKATVAPDQQQDAEIEILHQLRNCSKVLRLRKSFIFKSNCILIFDTFSYQLTEVLQNQPPKKVKLHIFRKICKTVKQIHKKGVVHLGITPENIVLSSTLTNVRLCNFEHAIQPTKITVIHPKSSFCIFDAPGEFFTQENITK